MLNRGLKPQFFYFYFNQFQAWKHFTCGVDDICFNYIISGMAGTSATLKVIYVRAKQTSHTINSMWNWPNNVFFKKYAYMHHCRKQGICGKDRSIFHRFENLKKHLK